jgi:hypothetical protein
MPAFFNRQRDCKQWYEAACFDHLNKHLIAKGQGFSEPMCDTRGRRLSDRQSIIIANARVASLIGAYGGFFRCPYTDPDEMDLWNIVVAVQRTDDDTPYPRRIR